jgi:hypothetical protein
MREGVKVEGIRSVVAGECDCPKGGKQRYGGDSRSPAFCRRIAAVTNREHGHPLSGGPQTKEGHPM